MCLIIDRMPGKVFPADKLEAAVLNNEDGFGIVTFDRGKVEVNKYFDPEKGNDPELVARLLEDAKDLRVLVHLRWKTQGTIKEDNCHPFDVLDNPINDGFQLRLMHNGTLSDFCGTDPEKVDSYNFAKELVKPLAHRTLLAVEDAALIHDPLFKRIVAEFAGPSNVITFFDTFSSVVHINRQRGIEGDGWWVSNSYSFGKPYRSKYKSTKTYGYYDSDWMWKDGEKDENATPPKSQVLLPPTTPKQTREIQAVAKIEEEPPVRLCFLEYMERAGFSGFALEDVATQLSKENLETLMEEEPEALIALCQDLIYELYQKKKGLRSVGTSKRSDGVAA